MKNIHLLPTEKPSKIHYRKGTNELLIYDSFHKEDVYTQPQHIYITYDEEIKDGDWVYCPVLKKPVFICLDSILMFKNMGTDSNGNSTYKKEWLKKIILTTDQDLIADGVQAISDEFLEWFVKNPGCEFVEVDESKYFDGSHGEYIIIIPKEEPKYSEDEFEMQSRIINKVWDEEESETLEEAEKEFEKLLNGKALPTKQLTEVAEHYFIVGYEIGQEKRYSEEEVIKLLIDCKDRFGGSDLNDYTTDGEVKRWFEQNKKK